MFELQPHFLRVRGRVAGLTAAELAIVGLTLFSTDQSEPERRGELTRVQSDGTLELQAHRGNHELFLVDATCGQWRTILARQALVLERDVEGLQLAPDPPAAPRR